LSLFNKSGKARFPLIVPSEQSHPQGERLEQPEDFEDDHDNNDHSNYVKDISVHGAHLYQIARAMVNTYRNFYQPSIENAPSESTQQEGKSPAVPFPTKITKELQFDLDFLHRSR
jgi:hypothetical protein